ncbi:DUF4232 domain-containing protein [Streptomyces sp. NPDC021096]|uniref:DUF4232 domain-containing protein n=1 Tax=Streptomyces sp. NPDC021096 TaxID=3154792 RepID=UPI0033FABE64
MPASARRADPHSRPFATAGLAVAALATLTLAACSGSGQGEGVRTEGVASSQSSGPGQAARPAEPSSSPQAGQAPQGKPTAGKGSSAGATPHGAQRTGTTHDPYAPENRVPCTAANIKVVATSVSRPLNHMLLTVTNTGSKMCDLKGYPVVKFEGAQSVPPVMEHTKPQAVTSLPPGGKGYASVILSAGDGSGGEGRTARHLEIGFQGDDSMAGAALPAGGVHIDDSLRVSYWLTSAEDALS